MRDPRENVANSEGQKLGEWTARRVSPAFVATCGPGAHVVSVGVVHMDRRCLVARVRRQKDISAAKDAAILRSSSIMTTDVMLSMS